MSRNRPYGIKVSGKWNGTFQPIIRVTYFHVSVRKTKNVATYVGRHARLSTKLRIRKKQFFGKLVRVWLMLVPAISLGDNFIHINVFSGWRIV